MHNIHLMTWVLLVRYIYFKLLHVIYLGIHSRIYSLFIYLLPNVLDFVQIIYYMYFTFFLLIYLDD